MSCFSFLFLDAESNPAIEAAFAGGVRAALPNQSFLTRLGNLLVHEYSYRLTSVSHAVGKNPRSSYTLTDDKNARIAVMWDFCDSMRTGWSTISPEALFRHSARHEFYCISAFSLKKLEAEHLDQWLRKCSLYVGAMELDVGNPIHIDLLWNWLMWGPAYKVGVGVDHERVTGIATFPPSDSFLSERGKVSLGVLKKRTSPTFEEQIAHGLRAAEEEDSEEVQYTFITSSESFKADLERKLRDYCLAPDGKGKDKADLFRSILGIESHHWAFLGAQLRGHLHSTPLHKVKPDQYGVRYRAYIPVVGINGIVRFVETGWMFDHHKGRETTPSHARLLTAYIAMEQIQLNVPSELSELVIARPHAGKNEYPQIHDVAHAHGTKAASGCVPTPFIVNQEVIPHGLCGGAYLLVKDGRSGFAHWLRANGIGEKWYRGGIHVSVETGSQSWERAKAYADAYAHVLRLNQIECRVESFLD